MKGEQCGRMYMRKIFGFRGAGFRSPWPFWLGLRSGTLRMIIRRISDRACWRGRRCSSRCGLRIGCDGAGSSLSAWNLKVCEEHTVS